MAYFPNGSAGMDYEQHFCSRCAHYGPEDGPGCPIWMLHLLWNYEACNGRAEKQETVKAVKYQALNALIPETADHLSAEQCKMFLPVEWLTDRGKFEIGKADQAIKDRLKLEEWNKLYGSEVNHGG